MDMSKHRRNRIMLKKSLRREIRLFLLIFLGYFCQVSVVPYFAIGGVTPLLTMSVIAIITVAYGRLQAFWCGAIYGLLYEVMLPTHKLFQLILYPAAALVGVILFPDKTAQQLEIERSMGKPAQNRSPLLRTVLCSSVNTLIYEIVNIVYVFLRESSITPQHFLTGFHVILYTAGLTCLIMLPIRRFLGYRYQRKVAQKPKRYVG